MWKPKLPTLPSLCDICLNANSHQIVPDWDENSNPLDWKFYVFCPLCFDSLINFFPITVKKIHNRELYGKFVP